MWGSNNDNFLFAEYPFFTYHRTCHKFYICAIDYIQLFSCGRKIHIFYSINGHFLLPRCFDYKIVKNVIVSLTLALLTTPCEKNVHLDFSAALQSSYKNNVRIVEYLVPPPAISDTK
jgi:hypothetical protein